ncbi:hypothetical protein T552_01118 [Pneumocystis carinii B80]|uniref:Uncharacterized protein n=1 Tax=Pneumocystis carinii (strain B80) TaxID=1408658 RepID=A0A0W4ZLA5_PNEC8|nr:hypothetical protein T552_01118 [Pneumocystis carinii B80]KTW29161.1 hypothetical protein T552_01118 [Pneumocystis carinii B80]
MTIQYLISHIEENAHIADIYSLAVTSELALTISGDSYLKIWDVDSHYHPLIHTFNPSHKIGGHSVTISKSGNAFIAASSGFLGDIIIWDLKEFKEIIRLGGSFNETKLGEAWAVALSPNGKLLATTSYKGSLNLLDISSRENILQLETRGNFGICIDYSKNGKYIATGHEKGGLYVFSVEKGKLLHSLQGHISTIRSVSFSPCSTFLAAGGDSKVITLYDVQSGEQVANLTGHKAWIFSLDWNITGEYLVSGAIDGTTKVWEIEKKECVGTQNHSQCAIWCVKWIIKGTGEGFISVGADKAIRWYRVAAAE